LCLIGVLFILQSKNTRRNKFQEYWHQIKLHERIITSCSLIVLTYYECLSKKKSSCLSEIRWFQRWTTIRYLQIHQ
jgi:hypothetical protein